MRANPFRNLRKAVCLTFIFAALAAAGCGGGGTDAPPSAGRVVFNVTWPKSRVPLGTVEIDVAATSPAGVALGSVRIRIPQHSGSIGQIPTGEVKFSAIALNVSGRVLAIAEQTVDIHVGDNSVVMILK